MRSKSLEGMVRISPLMGIRDVLQSSGLDIEQVLKQGGVDGAIFDDPDNLLSSSARAHLLHVCSDETGLPHFGLLVGKRVNLAAFGLVGYLAMHSTNVGDALQSLVHYLHLHGQGARAVLERDGSTGFFGYEIYQPMRDGRDQVEDAALAAAYNIMQQLSGKDWRPTEVWFTHRLPLDLQPYKQAFHAPLRFDMPRAGLFFPSRCLGREVGTADPELFRLLQKQINELESRYSEDFPEQVRRVLNHSLLSGHIDAGEVAGLFSIHSRTLHRRLKSHGVSFQQLLDECRYSVARHMLESSDTPLSHLAEILCYSDTRTFNRAFKRWAGTSPSIWRDQHGPRSSHGDAC